jgi:hypothetical protein
MENLTTFFITTDRLHSDQARESLERQNLVNPVVEIRNKYPLTVAYRHTLACKTDYCLVVDDDIILYRNKIAKLLRRFEEKRAIKPYLWVAMPEIRKHQKNGETGNGGGVRLWYMPHVREIGIPDVPHVSRVMTETARRQGYKKLRLQIVVGKDVPTTLEETYKNSLWTQLRRNAGQKPEKSTADRLPTLIESATLNKDRQQLADCLGKVDGLLVGIINSSKDAQFRGPVAVGVDFEAMQARDYRQHIDRGLAQLVILKHR